MQVVYSDKKSGKTAQGNVPKDMEHMAIGKKIGETIDGAIVGIEGYKLRITGLSDNAGAPSRKEIEGTRKANPLLGYGVGMRNKEKGYRARRLVRGNTISAETAQVNTFIEEYGTAPAESLFKKKEKAE